MPITQGDKFATFLFLSVKSELRSKVDGADSEQDFKDKLKAELIPLLNITGADFDNEVTYGKWTGIANILTTGADGKKYVTSDSSNIANEVARYSGGGSCPDDVEQSAIAAELKSIP